MKLNESAQVVNVEGLIQNLLQKITTTETESRPKNLFEEAADFVQKHPTSINRLFGLILDRYKLIMIAKPEANSPLENAASLAVADIAKIVEALVKVKK